MGEESVRLSMDFDVKLKLSPKKSSELAAHHNMLCQSICLMDETYTQAYVISSPIAGTLDCNTRQRCRNSQRKANSWYIVNISRRLGSISRVLHNRWRKGNSMSVDLIRTSDANRATLHTRWLGLEATGLCTLDRRTPRLVSYISDYSYTLLDTVP